MRILVDKETATHHWIEDTCPTVDYDLAHKLVREGIAEMIDDPTKVREVEKAVDTEKERDARARKVAAAVKKAAQIK